MYQNSLDITQHIIDSLNPAAGGACRRLNRTSGSDSDRPPFRAVPNADRPAARVPGCSHQPCFDDWSALRYSLRQQHTIAEPVRVEGFGYWSGLDVRVEFRPAPPDSGIVFVRADLDEPRRIPAVVD